ncbi:hypothetical protein BGZ95_007311 [Linnemannia exigua]|uniref:Crinkler effector protein N-terminal domain-containing protein n=1 Tax=Linnemannia exigua TaxID=604196 RepID=A0AAD4D0A9_9FUNG|nr:hypothetical protein BGZ95_007311 [Linnemannia exigua]
MSNHTITLFVMFASDDTSDAFPIEISSSKTVGHLKTLIKDANPLTLKDVDARRLRLTKVSRAIPSTGRSGIDYNDFVYDPETYDNDSLGPAQKLVDVFGYTPPDDRVHVLVKHY